MEEQREINRASEKYGTHPMHQYMHNWEYKREKWKGLDKIFKDTTAGKLPEMCIKQIISREKKSSVNLKPMSQSRNQKVY